MNLPVPPPTVVGIDPSLTRTAVATIPADGAVSLRRVTSTGRKDATLLERHARLARLRDDVLEHVPTGALAIIEQPLMGMAKGAAMTDRSGLWWMLVDGLLAGGCDVVPVNNVYRAVYALPTKGAKRDKDAVLAAALRRYPLAPIEQNDDADATLLAAIGRRLLGLPIEGPDAFTELQQATIDDMLAKLDWAGRS